MNPATVDQTLQLVCWAMGLVDLSLAFYILALNVRHTVNRHVGFMLLLLALNNFGVGQLIGAATSQEAWFSTLILAMVSPAQSPVLLLVTLFLLKPEWLQRGKHGLHFLLGLLIAVPFILTAIDLTTGTTYWFTGPAVNYSGGFIQIQDYAAGRFGQWVRLFDMMLMPVLTIALLLFLLFSFLLKRSGSDSWKLAAVLLVSQIVGFSGFFWLTEVLVIPAILLIATVSLTIGYSLVTFLQMVSERRLQRGRLQVRLTALLLSTALPSFAGVVFFISYRAGADLEQRALTQLQMSNKLLVADVSNWLEINQRALSEAASLPGMASMEPLQQQPILQSLIRNHPEWQMVGTLKEDGWSVVWSNHQGAQYYGGEAWFKKAASGAPATYYVWLDSQSSELLLDLAVPVRGEHGQVVGVLMAMMKLDPIAQMVQSRSREIGRTGIAYVVDGEDRVLAHLNQLQAQQLRDFSSHSPVYRLRHGQAESNVQFDDEQNQLWVGTARVLNNGSGWIVGVEQMETELLEKSILLQNTALATVLVGCLFLIGLSGVTIRQTLRPVATLTESVTAVATGELGRMIPVESEDELGVLSQAFNQMSLQLRDLVTGLEHRVAERTQVMERRARQLQMAAEVTRDVASTANLNELLQRAVELLNERLNFGMVALYLLDEQGQYLVLRTAIGSESWRTRIAGPRVRVSEATLAGQAVIAAQARSTVLEVDGDAHNQILLPLRVGDRVIGVLEVVPLDAGGLQEADMMILQLMADQLSAAIENSRLFNEAQETLRQLQAVYGQYTQDSWRAATSVRERPQGYLYRRLGVEALTAQPPEVQAVLAAGQAVTLSAAEAGEGGSLLGVPIKLRDQTLGVFKVRFETETVPEDAVSLIEDIAARLAVSLENARLLEETRNLAARERMVGEITAQVRAETEVEALLERALRELSLALNARRAAVQLEVQE